MSHNIAGFVYLNVGFPRSRGDEPARYQAKASSAMFSPLTRG